MNTITAGTKAIMDRMPEEMTYEEILEDRENINYMIENLNASITMYNQELLARLTKENLSGKIVGNKTITKIKMVKFDVKLDQAKELGAVKEVIDSTKLRALYNKGIDVPHKTIEYIKVADIDKGE